MKKLSNCTHYPLGVAALLLGFVGIGVGWFWLALQPLDPSSPTATPSFGSSNSKDTNLESVEELAPVLPSPSPALPTPTASPTPTTRSQLANGGASLGTLRVSNPTQHPMRVVLRKRQDSGSNYSKPPVHWDFAPGEGGSQGLILSLPQEELQLSKGDVLVAFALDGSRLYWGPYVVGETPIPVWKPQTSEWQLVLQP